MADIGPSFVEWYPSELLYCNIPSVVALVGCTQLHPQILKQLGTHKEFLLGNVDAPNYQVISVEIGHSIVPERKKERRQSYESYVPEGILKADWFSKHIKKIPSIVIVFFNWEDEKARNNKENDICNDLEQIKYSEFMLPLTGFKEESSHQKCENSCSLRSKNDATNDERITNIRKRAEIDSKNILFFDKDNMSESCKKLEKYMSETSKIYYKEEARRIKKDYIKSTISKYVQQVLTVRHHCKIALYAEFRKDQRTALKYYQSSYIQLRELFVNELKNLDKTKLIEFKVVADYLNFQICKLYLLSNNLNEAVNQFQKQIRSYLPNVILPQLEFEHWSWIARQYQIFAQLIEVLLASSISTFNKYSTQHPAYYYQATVKYLLERKSYAKKLCEPMRKSASGMTMLDKYTKESLEYYKTYCMDLENQSYLGQPSLNQLNHPLDNNNNADANKSSTLIEEILITKGIAKELSIDHSSLIIDILNKCLDHFKSNTNNSNRMSLYISYQLAQEYYASEKYLLALKYLERLPLHYKQEGWSQLEINVLSLILKCSMQLGNSTSYLNYALDLLNHYSHLSTQEREKLSLSILQVIEHPQDINMNTLANSIVKEMYFDNTSSLILCSVQFTNNVFYAKTNITLNVRFKSQLPIPFSFTKLNILFTDSQHNIVLYNDSNNLLLKPDDTVTIPFNMVLKEKAFLKISSIQLEYGNSPSSIVFQWKILGDKAGEIEPIEEVKTDISNIWMSRPFTKILEHESKLFFSVEHPQPPLLNEYYRIVLSLKNEGDSIANGNLMFHSLPNEDSILFYSEAVHNNEEEAKYRIKSMEIGTLETNETKKYVVYCFMKDETSKTIHIKAEYSTTSNYTTTTDYSIPIIVNYPFTPLFNFFSPQFQQLTSVSGSIVMNEPFFLYVDIQSNTSYPLQLSKSNLLVTSTKENLLLTSISTPPPSPLIASSLHQQQQSSDNNNNTENKGEEETVSNPVATCLGSTDIEKSVILYPDNRFTLWYQLVPSVSGEAVDIGNLALTWSRHSTSSDSISNNPEVVTKIPIPLLKINTAPFSVKIDVPPFSVVGSVIPITVSIYNNTENLQEFALSIGENTSFLFSGDKFCNFFIHPFSSYTMKHNLVALSAGRQVLPHFQITSKRYNFELVQTKQTRYIFINPPKVA